jgi:Ca2+-binding EF-hand superfamily protein
MKAFFALTLFTAGFALGQQGGKPPSVTDLIAELDKNEDGKISKEEADGSARGKRQFARWDKDQDGFATRDEIIAMRRKSGIDAEGNRIARRGGRDQSPAKLTIPAIADITRVGDGARPTRQEMQWSLTIVKTKPHPVAESGYLIVTDHRSEDYLAPLHRLAKHRKGTVVIVKDLATVHSRKEDWDKLSSHVQKVNPRFVAIAPRLESYREKMLIGMWKLLSTLDDDPELDVFPGLLVAPDAASFAKLITSSMDYKPRSREDFQAFAQCHFTDNTAGGIKSLQKVGILRKHFAKHGHETSSLIVAAPKVKDERPLKGDDIVYAVPERRLLKSFPGEARDSLAKSALLVMFGHGSTGMSCGFSVDAFHDIDLSNKVVMAGSCWSGAPTKLDFPMPRRDAAGTELEDTKERFLMRAIENGAVVSFGHMRLNQGFSTLYPVLESWTEGKTVGEGYQQLMNALFRAEKRTSLDEILALDPSDLKRPGGSRRSPAIPGNRLLYVIIGDPALQPFERLTVKK